jgi:hypothetical protein
MLQWGDLPTALVTKNTFLNIVPQTETIRPQRVRTDPVGSKVTPETSQLKPVWRPSTSGDPSDTDPNVLDPVVEETEPHAARSITPTHPPKGTSEGLELTFKSGVCSVKYKAPKRKISGRAHLDVSPPFELAFENDFPAVPFRIVARPSGGDNFACGKASLQLKHETESGILAPAANIRFRFLVGSSESPLSCDPVVHDFSREPRCTLSKEWDLKSASSKDLSVLVTLEILPPE